MRSMGTSPMVTLPTHQQSFSTRGTALTRDARGDRIADGGAAGTGHYETARPS